MIGGKSVGLATIHGQHADYAMKAFERHREHGAQGGEARRIANVSRFCLRISVDDGLPLLRDPAAQPFSQPDVERRKQPEIIAAYQFRHEPVFFQQKHGQRIVRNHLAQTYRKHRERFAEAQRVAKILAKLEHGLRFLAGGGDRRQEIRLIG